MERDYFINKTNGNPFIQKYFLSYEKEYSLDLLYLIFNKIKTNKNILKNLNFKKNPESLSDDVDEILLEHKFKLFIKKNLSSRYLKLLNNNNLQILKNIYLSSNNKEYLSKDIFKNIATCYTQESFYNYLHNYFYGNFLITKENLLKKIKKDKNLILESIYKNIFVVQVLSFESMKMIGSNKWCITNHQDFFDYYQENGYRQFVVFDFNKNQSNKNFIVGISVNIDGNIIHSYNRNNEKCNVNLPRKIKKESYKNFLIRNKNINDINKIIYLIRNNKRKYFSIYYSSIKISEKKTLNLLEEIEHNECINIKNSEFFTNYILYVKKYSKSFINKTAKLYTHLNDYEVILKMIKNKSLNKLNNKDIFELLEITLSYYFIDLFFLLFDFLTKKENSNYYINKIINEIIKYTEKEELENYISKLLNFNNGISCIVFKKINNNNIKKFFLIKDKELFFKLIENKYKNKSKNIHINFKKLNNEDIFNLNENIKIIKTLKLNIKMFY